MFQACYRLETSCFPWVAPQTWPKKSKSMIGQFGATISEEKKRGEKKNRSAKHDVLGAVCFCSAMAEHVTEHVTEHVKWVATIGWQLITNEHNEHNERKHTEHSGTMNAKNTRTFSTMNTMKWTQCTQWTQWAHCNNTHTMNTMNTINAITALSTMNN